MQNAKFAAPLMLVFFTGPAIASSVIVQSGETLTSIAERELGNRNLWRQICDLNEDALPNCDIIVVGTEIIVPDRPDANTESSTAEQNVEPPPANLIDSSMAFDTPYWSGYFLKPDVEVGIEDPEGGTGATRIASADRSTSPGVNFSGFFVDDEADPGTYDGSVWARSTSGALGIRVGISDRFMVPGEFELTAEWQRIEFSVDVTEATNRTFQIFESTENNPAWEIYAPIISRR